MARIVRGGARGVLSLGYRCVTFFVVQPFGRVCDVAMLTVSGRSALALRAKTCDRDEGSHAPDVRNWRPVRDAFGMLSANAMTVGIGCNANHQLMSLAG
jgi:hypothetical protein